MTYKRESVSEALESLILKGYAEVAGIAEDRDLVFGLTENGERVANVLREMVEGED